VRRVAAWLLTIPVAGLGVLVGHALAYRLAGVPVGGMHDYLSHVPQVMLVLATVAVAAAAFPTRAPRVAATPVASVAIVGFAVQEHVERLAHTGELPWLLNDRAFVLGLVLQLPVALACLALARIVAGPVAGWRRLPPVVPAFSLPLTQGVASPVRMAVAPSHRGRSPPRLPAR
jgi:hypothetical protein